MKGHAPKLDFLVVGGARCGTSWLYHCMEEHPDICVSSIKEVPFFNHSYNFSKGAEYYIPYFRHCSETALRGECNPNYLQHPEVPRRIAETYPHVKIIMSMRDPVEAVISRYLFMQQRGMHRAGTFEQFLSENPQYLEEREYDDHLERFFRFFSPEQIHVIIHDDIERRPRTVLRNMFRFLNVRSDIVPSNTQYRIHTRTQHSRLKFAQPLYKAHAFLQQYYIGDRLIDLVSKSPLRRWLEDTFEVNTAQSQASQPDEILPSIRARLYDHYRPHVTRLEQMICRDLSHWYSGR